MKILAAIFVMLVSLCGIAALHGAAAFEIGVLRYDGGDWYSCIDSVRRFVAAVNTRETRIRLVFRERGLYPDEREFFEIPFQILNGHDRVELGDERLRRLRDYLDGGGFLFVNDDYGLDKSFRIFVKRLFPTDELVPLPADDPLYRAWYRLPGLPKIHQHDGLPAVGYGLFRNGRMVLFYAASADIIDGWDPPEVHGNPEALREAAYQMGVNLLVQALTR